MTLALIAAPTARRLAVESPDLIGRFDYRLRDRAALVPHPGALQADALAALEHLPAVALATLVAAAPLMTRTDRKYLVDLATVPALLGALAPTALALQVDDRRAFGYRSAYFDTPELTSYLLSARRRPRRFKVRTRTYLDSGDSWLEVKTRDRRGRTVKQRIPWPEDQGPGLRRAGRAFVAQALAGTVADPADLADVLGPELSTSYQRATLLLPAQGARVTLDVELEATRHRGPGLRVRHLAVIETKTAGPACAADRALWALGQRPVRVSKYATLLAALDPQLPAHRWRPALRRIAADASPTTTP